LRVAGDLSVARIVTAGERVALGLLNEADGLDGQISVFEVGSEESSWDLEVGGDVGGEVWSLVADGTLFVAAKAWDRSNISRRDGSVARR